MNADVAARPHSGDEDAVVDAAALENAFAAACAAAVAVGDAVEVLVDVFAGVAAEVALHAGPRCDEFAVAAVASVVAGTEVLFHDVL